MSQNHPLDGNVGLCALLGILAWVLTVTLPGWWKAFGLGALVCSMALAAAIAKTLYDRTVPR